MSDTQSQIDLYYWPTPNGWKISILLEELGLAYKINYINIGKGEQFNPDFLEIAPNNRMPAIVDPDGPDGEPISIFESGAIMQYLARKHNRFYGTDARESIEIDQWLMWQMGGFGPMLGQNHHFTQYAPEQVPYAIRRYQDETHRLYGVLNQRLEGREYITKTYSIADMACLGWAKLWEGQNIDLTEFPHIQVWLDRVMARPAVTRGLDLGQDYRKELNLAENKDAQSVLFNQKAR